MLKAHGEARGTGCRAPDARIVRMGETMKGHVVLDPYFSNCGAAAVMGLAAGWTPLCVPGASCRPLREENS
ncbi:hypothetical protein GCM10022284_43730 [Streptomyces hundungensis]